MIAMRQIESLGSVSVDFDEYVPLTITWSSASRILEQPIYVELQDINGYLEFKFDPSSGVLIELVLASAPGIKVEQASLSPRDSEEISAMPFIVSEAPIREIGGPLGIRAYSDYLYLSFGPDPDRWVGSGPVLFGVAGERDLTAICAKWSGSERESVLANFRLWRRLAAPQRKVGLAQPELRLLPGGG
jgi:hypothetical protein